MTIKDTIEKLEKDYKEYRFNPTYSVVMYIVDLEQWIKSNLEKEKNNEQD